MLICFRCFEMYDKYNNLLENKNQLDINDEGLRCPKLNCVGTVYDIDELIAPTIILLNKKGFVTKYCCSGHWYDDYIDTYILFHENIKIFQKIPEGFRFNGNHLSNIINNGKKMNIIEKYNEVIRINNILYKWAKGLRSEKQNIIVDMENVNEVILNAL